MREQGNHNLLAGGSNPSAVTTIRIVGYFFLIVFLAILSSPPLFAADQKPVSYWLWAGLTERDLSASADSRIYIYQGVIDGSPAHVRYTHKGIFPYPIKHANIQIVFRLTAFVDPQEVANIYLDQVDAWNRSGVPIQGIQLDYDCPTSKLDAYGAYLERLRSDLPPSHKLSVTGLGDWVLKGDARSLKRIASAAEDITFQIYQGRQTLVNGFDYIDILKHAEFSFRIGLLANDRKQDWLDAVRPNPHYHGVVYFLQK